MTLAKEAGLHRAIEMLDLELRYGIVDDGFKSRITDALTTLHQNRVNDAVLTVVDDLAGLYFDMWNNADSYETANNLAISLGGLSVSREIYESEREALAEKGQAYYVLHGQLEGHIDVYGKAD